MTIAADYVAPHALLSCATTRETSGRKGKFVHERRALRVVVLEQSEEVGVPYVPCVCVCARLEGLVMTRRSGRPLTMRMRMDMLMRSVTRAAKVATGSSRGGARVSARILARHDMHRRTYWPSTRASRSSRSVPHTARARHSRARSSSGNDARGICKIRRISSFRCRI